jgi:hypothetical protein
VFFALKLVGCGGAQCGVERDVVAAIARRPRLDVTAVLPFGACAAAAALDLARQAVERRVEATRREFLAGLDALAAFPPVGVLGLFKDVLWRGRRFGFVDLGVWLTGGFGQPLTFFSASAAASGDEGSSLASLSS